MALATGADQDRNHPAEGAFQKYPVISADLAVKIPANISYEQAAVVPFGLATAASSLFQKGFLALDLPTVPARPSNGKTLLVWGGSSSVGCNAIQLAVLAGYEVFTTVSPRNFELVKKLGASQVFDHNEKMSPRKSSLLWRIRLLLAPSPFLLAPSAPVWTLWAKPRE